MKLITIFLALGLFFNVQAWLSETQNVIWVTITTDVYTTFCPSSTEFSYGPKVYTASPSQFVTITDCPCTYSQTVEQPSLTNNISNSTSQVPPQISPSSARSSQVLITLTETVSELTTFFSSSTMLVQNSKTYTVTEPTTLTITDCPCTISRVVPGTISTATVSELTTFLTGSTTITLSGITYPVSSAGPMTIPLVHVSTIPIQSDSTRTSSLQTASPITVAISENHSPSVIKSTNDNLSVASTPETNPLKAGSSIIIPSLTVPSMTIPSITIPILTSPSKAGSSTTISSLTSPSKASSSMTGLPITSSSKTGFQAPEVTGNVAIKIDARIGAVAAAGFAAVFL